ncbi:MAG: hypothetical protein ACRC8K_19055 [Waterburya sp.]
MLIKTSVNNLSEMANRMKKLPFKFKREISKIPPLKMFKEQAYQNALDEHAQFLPQLDSQGKSIVKTLQEEGTCIIPIEELGLATTNTMMRTAFKLAERLKRRVVDPNSSNNCELGSSPEDLRREFPEILLWALEPKLLDIVENYIGLPILYQYFAMRRSIADGQYFGVRRWHIDMEDRRTIKIIIYLNDVVAGGGPYQYIPRQITDKAIEKLNYYNFGYVSDEVMTAAVPQSSWGTCLGKVGSLVISDTSNVFHRAQPPTENERFSISFCYTSIAPNVTWKSRKISPQQWEYIDRHTNQRQKDCLNKKSLILL